VWGKTWIQAKTQAECYDYLFEAAVKMRQLGIDASQPPAPLITNGHTNGPSAPVAKKRKTGQVGKEQGSAAARCTSPAAAARCTRPAAAACPCTAAAAHCSGLHQVPVLRSLRHQACSSP
jgi:hypothetical protein